ncbi:uncharacterized protein LOC108739282 isoform X2 [Agrilus planipennis]|uniref:Uncharacterized protein LOC108739282 isoform X2 n=1 Tax=Agrilus planipennis TaxID=224129 RepID=A0A1W4WXL7_AGRPL|nr:uncharacterized protein LOC108739282 isoform X2 [Agrilus planipennis]
MRLFKRRNSDPSPHTIQNGSCETYHPLDVDCCTSKIEGVSYLDKKLEPNWDFTKTNSSEFLSEITGRSCWTPWQKRIGVLEHKSSNAGSQSSSIENIPYGNQPKKSKEFNKKQTPDTLHSDLKKIYEIYKECSNTKKTVKYTARSKRKLKSTMENLELNEKQLLDYLLLVKPDAKELKDLINDLKANEKRKSKKMTSLAEENTGKTLRKKKSVRNLFSLSFSKSDDESECINRFKRTSSSGSLSSLSDMLMHTKKALSLSEISSMVSSITGKSDESGYSTDSTRNPSSLRASFKSTCSDSSNLNTRDVTNITFLNDTNESDKTLRCLEVDSSYDNFDKSRTALGSMKRPRSDSTDDNKYTPNSKKITTQF